MSSDSTNNQVTAIVEIDPNSNALVETKTPELQTDDVMAETIALIEAVGKRAQAEIQAATDLTREAYLRIIRQAREAVEQNKIIDRDRIEDSIQHLQKETDKSWHVVAGEVESIGIRMADTARVAWHTLMDTHKQ